MLLYEWKTTPNFFVDINKDTSFLLESLNGNGSDTKFKVILATNINQPSSIENNFDLIIDENGHLDYNSFNEIPQMDDYSDVYFQYQGTQGGGFNISSSTPGVAVDVGSTTVNLRGMFLVNQTNEYLLGYTIFPNNIGVANNFTIPISGTLMLNNKII